MGVNVKVDGVMVLGGALVAAGLLLYLNRDKFNPASPDNIVNQAAVDAVGQENLTGFFDPLFAARELIMDWTYPGDYEASPYAREIWGIGE